MYCVKTSWPLVLYSLLFSSFVVADVIVVLNVVVFFTRECLLMVLRNEAGFDADEKKRLATTVGFESIGILSVFWYSRVVHARIQWRRYALFLGGEKYAP